MPFTQPPPWKNRTVPRESDVYKRQGIPPRFAASKLAEGDRLVLERLDLDQNEKDALEHIISQMEAERGLDRSAAIADMRFGFIGRVCERTVVKPGESREQDVYKRQASR